MSDQVTSGNAATAPAETTHAATSGGSQPDFAFGSSRGSGLARGKRNSPAAPAASTPASTSYAPTVIEMINPKSEYQNPFAPVEQPAPVAAAPVEEVKPAAVAPVAPAPVAPVKPAPAPVAEAPARVEEEPKAELKILPPTEVKHPAQRWEAPAQSNHGNSPRRHEERPTFKPERRERRENSDGFTPREPREGFTPRENRGPREPRPEGNFERRPDPKPAAPAKSGGFIGWLKGLFGSAPETPVEAKPQREDSQHQPRRHRGGRGRSRNYNGPRSENNSGPRSEHGGEHGHAQGDRPRRRSRGGRNRNRDGNRGGGGGGYPRSEGQQGGGAI